MCYGLLIFFPVYNIYNRKCTESELLDSRHQKNSEFSSTHPFRVLILPESWNSHCISNHVLVCSNRVPNASNYILAHSNVSFPPANVGPRLLPHGMSDERRLHEKEPEIILSHVHVRWLLERECCMYTERTMLWWNRMYLRSV